MTIVLEISPPGSLDLSKKLEWRRDGIEVLSSNLAGGTEVVALYVPDGKLSAFEQRIRDYLTKDNIPKDPTQESKPAKAALVNAIESFRRAAFDELWTDESADPPPYDQEGWVQIWLRRGSQPPKEIIESFSAAALPLGVKVEPGYLTFPGRVVVAAQCTRTSLEQALYLLDQIAEMRSVRPNPEFFLSDLKPREQADWIQDLQGRLTFSSPESSPYVTLLDTGVNDGHVLLSPVLDPADLHAVHSAWGV